MRNSLRENTNISRYRRNRSSLPMDCIHRIKDISMRRFLLAACLLGSAMTGLCQDDVPTPQWRPVYHFTPSTNWTNDPNGPIWLNGEYLLYNQQNPFENKWGHMSWGHATSKDL